MLTTSHLNSSVEENDLSTYLIIPFDSIKNPDDFAQLRILPDGTLYIINAENQQVQDKTDFPSLEEKIVEGGSQQTCTLPLTSVPPSSLIHVPTQSLLDNNPEISIKYETINEKNILPSTSEVKYNCIKCDNNFTSVKEYKHHLKWHKYQKKFKCSSCAAGYNVENNLKIHNALIHPKGTLKSCPICGISLTFQRAASLNSHLMVHLVEELHNCDECDAEIEKEDEYTQHMLTHVTKNKDESSLICSYCDVEFKTKRQLKLHVSDHAKAWRFFKKKKVKRITSKERRYNCKICNKSFIKHSLLERHVRIHSGEKPFKCSICDQCFTQKGTLQIHLLRHTGNKPFGCTLCAARFNQKGNLRVHINKTHTSPNEAQKMFKCPHCSCIFKRIASLNGHVTKAHLKYRFMEENLIENVMKNLKDLEEHPFDSYVTLTESTPEGAEKKFVVQMKRMGDVRWYMCSYCSKMCKKPSDLIRHIRVHTREKPFTCKVCRKSFSLKSTLISHMNTHNSAKNVKCKMCDSAFGSKKILNLHMRKHESEKMSKWHCITCGILFDEFEKALQHKMSQEQPHTIQSVVNKVMKQPLYQTVYGNLNFKPPRPKIPNTGNESSVLRPFLCIICDARFTKKVNLIRHMKYHESDRKYKCHMCPKAFLTSYRLKHHINLHNNIKNYPCKTCNKRFGTSTNLRRHMITHNNQKPYMCPYCSKHFQTLDLSRRHIKTVHKKDVLPKIDKEIDNLKQTVDKRDISRQATSVIICNKNSTDEELHSVTNSDNLAVQQIVLEESSQPNQILNPVTLQDPSTGLQTYYVNLGDLQLIGGNSGISLSSLVENVGHEEHLQLTANDHQEKDQNRQNPVMTYVSSTQMTNTLNLTPPIESDVIFDGNTIIDTSTGLSESRNIFDDASIICMNCNKMFSSFVHFQKHNCINSNKEQNAENVPEVFVEVIPEKNIDQQVMEKELTATEPEPEDDSKKIECTVCKKVFTKTILYRKHMKIHSNVRCLKCKQVFSSKAAYLEHATVHNVSVSGNLFECEFCSKRFKKSSDLTRHIRTHTGEKPFGCEICNKKFSLKSTLQSHIKTHDPNHKQFGCDICNTFFSFKSSLKVHMTIHTGQMPYSCSVCKAKFRTLGAKKAHEAVGHRRVLRKKVKKATKNNLTDILQTLSSDLVTDKNKEQIQDEVPEYVPLETLNLVMTQNNLAAQNQTLLDLPSQIVNLDIPPETILSTIPEVQLPEDPSNLLQQLQMTDMVLTTNETEAVPSLILEDVSFLDLNPVANNLQIISLPEVDGRVTISIKESAENGLNEAQPKPEKEKEKRKPVECDICHKTYASKDGLRKHKKNIHGDKKKFPCDKCGEKFDSKEKLNDHEKEHCLCTLCAMKFSEENSLENHMDSYHSSKEQTSALLNLKLDLPSATIDEPLFNNIFMLKKE